jgi:hypothetical protein
VRHRHSESVTHSRGGEEHFREILTVQDNVAGRVVLDAENLARRETYRREVAGQLLRPVPIETAKKPEAAEPGDRPEKPPTWCACRPGFVPIVARNQSARLQVNGTSMIIRAPISLKCGMRYLDPLRRERVQRSRDQAQCRLRGSIHHESAGSGGRYRRRHHGLRTQP